MLTSMTLDNFKCFSRQTLGLGGLTLLTGLNGAGKSSLIQSMLLLRQSLMEGMLPAKGLLLNGPLVRLGTAQDVLFRGAEKDEIGIRLDKGSEIERWQFGYGSQYADILPVLAAPSTHGMLTGEMHYIAAERIGPRYLYEISQYEVEQRHEMGADGRYAVAFLDSVASKVVPEVLRHPDAPDTTVRSQVPTWLGEIAPGAFLRMQPYPELNRVTLGFGFQEASAQTMHFSPPNVGFGLSYVLPILVAVLGTGTCGIVVIENPEAHLHPRAQSVLGTLICRGVAAGLQIIVETHSDHVLNGVRLAVKDALLDASDVRVHFFGRRSGTAQVEHFVESLEMTKEGRIDRWPPGFFDEWENSLDRLLD